MRISQVHRALIDGKPLPVPASLPPKKSGGNKGMARVYRQIKRREAEARQEAYRARRFGPLPKSLSV